MRADKKIIDQITNAGYEADVRDYFDRNEKGTLTYINAIFLNGKSALKPFIAEVECSSLDEFDEALDRIMTAQHAAGVHAEENRRLVSTAVSVAFSHLWRETFSPLSGKEMDKEAAVAAGRILGACDGYIESLGTGNVEDFALDPRIEQELRAYLGKYQRVPAMECLSVFGKLEDDSPNFEAFIKRNGEAK